MAPKWDFGGAMLPVGTLCFYQAHFGRTVLPKWPFWAHLFYSVFYNVSELRRACFRQARASLEPCFRQAHCFVQGPLRSLPVPPKSHMRPLPHLGVSDLCNFETQVWLEMITSRDAKSRRAPNVHQQMCTTRKPFQRLGGLLSNHPNQNQKMQQIIK